MLSTPKAKAELYLASSLYDGLEDNNIKQVTTLLLNKEADPNILIPSQGITPFHLVIGNDSETFAEEVTKLFLRYGGNPNVRSVDGMTPVHVGAAWGRVAVLELLLASGGDPLLLDYEGRSPFHYAFDEAHYDAITVLGKYCGEVLDEDTSPKYKMALGRVRVNNKGIVAEYAVSDDPSTTVNDIPIIKVPKTCNNNNNNSTNSPSEPLVDPKNEKHVVDWQKEGGKNSISLSSTADESSCSAENVATLIRHPRCFPRKSERNKKPQIDCKLKFEEGQKCQVSEIIEKSKELATDESFFVRPKREGEIMPRISSPKPGKTEKIEPTKTTPKPVGNQGISGKFKYKTPIRVIPKKEQSSSRKTPLTISKFGKKPESAEELPVKKETKTAERIADCSMIISKSPNLMITPSNVKKKIPLQKKTSPKSTKKSAARFVKQSDLRHQSPIDTPNSARNLQNIKSLVKAPKSCDLLREKKRQIPGVRKREINGQTESDVLLERSQFNKTYCKNEACFSPEVDVLDRTIDRRVLAKKNIAVKLHETMYDEVEKNIDASRTNEILGNLVKSEKCVSPKILASFLSSSNKPAELENVVRSESSVLQNMSASEETGENRKSSKEHKKHFYLPCKNELDTELSGIARLPSYVEPEKKWQNARIPPSFGPNAKEIDESSLSTDDSNCHSEGYNRDCISSDGIELRADFILEKESGGNSCARNKQFFNGDVQRVCSFSTRAENQINASMTSSCESFVSLEEEYKYEDPEEGVVLLERRLLVTPVSIPMVKRERSPLSTSGKSSCDHDDFLESCASSLPQSLAIMDSETLRKELTILGQPPGPITATTRGLYLNRLWKLQKRAPLPVAPSLVLADAPKFSAEIEKTLRSADWLKDLAAYEALDNQAFAEFAKPDPTRRWREGTTKSSFNYLLLDPRATLNLPSRAASMSLVERWRTFVSSVFYVGKGKRARPYSHLYEATTVWNQGQQKNCGDKKIKRILDIWRNGCGVVCLHVFQNTIPVEAYTREAAMIEVLGLERLENCKSGEYYGVAATWSSHQKRQLGMYLLYRAMQILLYEGERQLCPENI